MRILFVTCILAIASQAFGLSSSHMKKFEISQCSLGKCFSAHGELAFVSSNGSQLVADNVSLKLLAEGKTKNLQCQFFRYSIPTQKMMCDEILIDSNFEISILQNPPSKRMKT